MLYIAKFLKIDEIIEELTKLTLTNELKKKRKKVLYITKFPKSEEIIEDENILILISCLKNIFFSKN